jgi:hypothetical protein
MKYTINSSQNRGSIIVSILIVLIFLTTTLFALATLTSSSLIRARGRIMLLQAQYSAESGADAAIAILNSGDTSYTGTTSEVQLTSNAQYKATYSVTVAPGSDEKERIITSIGKIYRPASAATPEYSRKIRVVAQRSSTTTASSMLSRNIIDVGSGVKQITGRDVFVNGFIIMRKNTTVLRAENITVVGKNTGPTNCSISGSGTLEKPATFTNPGQTKTKLMLGYNNCISPPGNSSDDDFDVLPNQTNLSAVQSAYIPWNQYMDSTYTNAGSCSDWTTGGSIRQIPLVLGSKKTHYPDSGSNISNTCGSSGNIALGNYQYNITDNAHIRGNLCGASACDPIFFNPDTTVKYIFIEGTVNFNSVKTASGSGPIVFITYGTDPASKASVCPYGGSVYIGQSGSGNTDAPALYILAMNGLCIDGTKFDSSSSDPNAPVFGGIGGKNLYIASSPSTPRPLLLDPEFPVDQIPIDLAWREARYQRL